MINNSLKSQKQKQSGTDKLLKEIKQKKEFQNNKNLEDNASGTPSKNDIQNNKNLIRGIESSNKIESSSKKRGGNLKVFINKEKPIKKKQLNLNLNKKEQ